MGLRESGVEIITAIIGSTLLVTTFTSLLSEIYYQPILEINVITHKNNTFDFFNFNTNIEYYEINIKNNGKGTAKNLTVSSFFFGEITNYSKIFYGKDFEIESESSKQLNSSADPRVPSLLLANLQKLSPGANIIIYVWVEPWKTTSFNQNNRYFDELYYIVADYDEGSSVKVAPKLLSSRQLEGSLSLKDLPTIESKRELSIQEQLTVVPLVLSLVFFAFALRHRKLKKKKGNTKIKLERSDEGNVKILSYKEHETNYLFLVSLVILTSCFIFFIIEIPLVNYIESIFPALRYDITK